MDTLRVTLLLQIAIFFLRVILYTFFLFLFIYGGLGVGVFGVVVLVRVFVVGVFNRWCLRLVD